MSARIAAALQDLVGPRVATGWSIITGETAVLPQEAAGLARATDARRAEFAAGRRAAHSAMRALGLPERPVPMAIDRAPVWPPGLCGSISHAKGLALAAVAQGAQIAGIGIDIEPAEALAADLAAVILSPAEAAALPDPTDRRAGFAAKEALFKALYPGVGTVFGFDAVRLVPAAGGFVAELTETLGPYPCGAMIPVAVTRRDGRILAAVVLHR